MSDLRFGDGALLEQWASTDGRIIAGGERTKRYKLRFRNLEAMNAALAAESSAAIAVTSHSRLTVSVDLPNLAAGSSLNASLANDTASSIEALGLRPNDVKIVEDFRYDLEEVDLFDPNQFGPDDTTQPSLEDVVMQIGAREAWSVSRGAGVVIAIIDTGIDGTRPEFPQDKRFAHSWAPEGEDAWTDRQGHGTMCATIAAGTRANGGVFDGVAPDAKIMSCRTYFYDTELADIYDRLAALAQDGHIVVASNSFGLKRSTPPPVPEGSDFPDALQQALDAGVIAFFSAGNYHHLAGGLPTDHEPNTVWLHKGRADLMTVGAVKPDQSMWYYSSRGPGQFFGDSNTNMKPDIVGVTPPNGRVVYGAAVRTMGDGWGTSGCCPQAAGLAALMLSKRARDGGPPLLRDQLFDIVRSTSTATNHRHQASGAGIINCLAALGRV